MESADGKDLERALDNVGCFIRDVERRLHVKLTDTNIDEIRTKYREYLKKPEFPKEVVANMAAEAFSALILLMLYITDMSTKNSENRLPFELKCWATTHFKGFVELSSLLMYLERFGFCKTV